MTAPVHYAVGGWLLALAPSGAARRLTALLGALPAQLRAHERVTVLVGPGPTPRLDPRLAVHAIDVPPRPTWRRAMAERRLLPRTLAALGADLLHLESLPLPPRLPCATCLHLHDLRDLGPFRRRPRWLAARVIAAAVRRAARITVPSAHVRDRLASRFGIAAAAVDVVPAPPGLHPREGVATGGGEHLLHVGHLERRKNLGLLIEAWAAARDAAAATPPPLLLAGADHGQRRRLERLARRLRVDARFLGAVDDDELDRLLARSRAVLVPSWEEGFGMPALEALAYGRPVLVSDRAALPEVVAEAGTVLPADDVAAWARALLAPDGRTTPAARVARAREFAAEHAAAALLRAWRAALSPGPAASPGSPSRRRPPTPAAPARSA